LSDPANGLGAWVHHELVAPVTGAPFRHGWAALFRRGVAPVLARFGPEALTGPSADPVDPDGVPGDGPQDGLSASQRAAWAAVGALVSTAEASLAFPSFRGRSGTLAWDLTLGGAAGELSAGPLWTFPRWAWERELLPGSQALPTPSAPVRGTFEVAGEPVRLSDLTSGGVAHIYGHGSAERWGWLHGELGRGDVVEVVAAVGRRPGLRHLPPAAFVQLTVAGRTWPRDPLLAARHFRTELGTEGFSVEGSVGRRRLRLRVRLPEDQVVVVAYQDPDGSSATCTNSEVADASVRLERRTEGRWVPEGEWSLAGTAHAEVGVRP
jgi:hypothetical protein